MNDRPARSAMAPLYLALGVAGYLLPGVPMLRESVETGNWLFWADPARTTAQLFANRTSTAFALDLTAVVVVALIWMTVEARRVGLPRVWRFWLLTALFGLGGTLPLFLWSRERRLVGAGAPTR
jgi:Terpene cyclase DEP1